MQAKRAKKKEEMHIASLVIPLALLFCMNNILTTFSEYIDNWVYGHLESRTIDVTVEDSEEEEILFDFLAEKAGSVSYTEKILLYVQTTKLSLPECYCQSYDQVAIEPYLKAGESRELESGEAIIAKYFTSGTDTSIWYDGEELLGSVISCKIQTSGGAWIDYEITVVGVYDNVASGFNYGFLMNEDEMNKIRQISDGIITSEEDDAVTLSGYKRYSIIVKNYEEVDTIRQELKKKTGLPTYLVVEMDPRLQYFVSAVAMVSNFFSLALLFNAIIDIIYVTEYDIRTRRQEFGLLKALGYREREIDRILQREAAVKAGATIGITALVGAAVLTLLSVAVQMSLSIYYSANLIFLPHGNVVAMTLAAALGALGIGYLVGAECLHRLEAGAALRDVRE